MKKIIQHDIHEDKIVELALWAFGFGDSYGGHIFFAYNKHLWLH
jgi:hypothetical protein